MWYITNIENDHFSTLSKTVMTINTSYTSFFYNTLQKQTEFDYLQKI